ncbi:geranylgeranylglycerol-phosphate geranylgeranyltransferase [Vulcanisaeta souniana]|uniref:Prenyltransferase UbiA n=1 Tax=Vulcanisaeta souniana JCM 11219 TaxID=1293586 RepID=A0A830EH76_9CREN|nr:geranylgeranylglycerol-phosphate geranylgeranyltransferase [Vulcanisaeta souniana]BDR92602.1 prenyltransferase UbiA [Vulcanisaeta souniana JCM 11219]GGI82582.1 prenyltransferase UbiA [Vulcanisaeta souniana JCM 11219]
MNLRAFIKLSRIEHGVLTSLIVVASYIIAGGRSAIAMALLFLASLLTEIFLFATNDIFNVEEDRVNRPDAPIVSGEVSIREAWALSLLSVVIAVLLNVLGIAMRYLMDWSIVILALAIFLGFFYNYGLKRVIIVNNVLVAITSSLTFLYGLYAVSSIPPTLNLPYLLFIVSFLATMGRELVKGALDVAGDARAGVKTMANVYGIRTAVIMAVAFTLLAVAVSPLIIISSRGFPGIILSIGVVITDAMLLYISIVVLTRPNYMSRFRTLALGAMSITIIAYLLFALLLIL